ncbi:unnamed protein product [Dracunculus medinensis]|uniref:Secreted protein n=1 Tax=Dracunculus medinensis TaxID=318479 RepID=A0A0N4URE5_DRAME|nr:unnamed protein product [Dracunculus medinensis]
MLISMTISVVMIMIESMQIKGDICIRKFILGLLVAHLFANVESEVSLCGANAQGRIHCYDAYNKNCMRCNCNRGYAVLRGRCVLEAIARQATSGRLQRSTESNLIALRSPNCGTNMLQLNRYCERGTCGSLCYCVDGYHRYGDECTNE